ncbi:hypothetical protein FRC09_017490, partial [Ceratobasidium sp. 395]
MVPILELEGPRPEIVAATGRGRRGPSSVGVAGLGTESPELEVRGAGVAPVDDRERNEPVVDAAGLTPVGGAILELVDDEDLAPLAGPKVEARVPNVVPDDLVPNVELDDLAGTLFGAMDPVPLLGAMILDPVRGALATLLPVLAVGTGGGNID